MSATARPRTAIRRAAVKTTVTKRDGRKVPFDAGKIENAVTKCFMNALRQSRGEAMTVGAEVASTVANILSRRGDDEVGVEEVQQLVIQQLWAADHFQAAEHYTLYREQRRQTRESRPIDPELERRINEDAKHFPHPIQYYQFLSKFSRWRPDEKRRETWREACTRVMDFFKRQERLADKLTEEEWGLLDRYLYEQKATCAMRVVQMAGPALDRCHVGVYNCLGIETQFVTRDGVKSFWDFKDGDKTTVLTHTGAWKPATVRCHGKQKLYKHVIKRGRTEVEVRATEDHRWILHDGSVSTGLNIGDRLHKPPTPAAGWSYDAAEPFEKLAWAYGYVYGDGTRVKMDGEYRYSMVRLCGADAGRFAERFEELGFASSRPLSYGGDIVVYTGSYLKTLPPVDQDLALLRAFVRGYLDADGAKRTSTQTSNEFPSIQATGKEATEFIRKVFPMVGFYITREETITDPTNFGERSDTTIRFGLLNSVGNAPNSYHSLSSKSAGGSFDLENVWCLDVEDDHSFVLSEGVVTGNCSYLPVTDWFSFAELLYILMQGTGAGFSVECDYVEQLPRIRRQRKGAPKHKFQIEDSTEGWCDAFFFGLQKWAAGEDVEYDYSLIRPAGTPLKTKGGRASGPEPLKQLMEFARNLILAKQGGHLSDLDCHDLACMTGKIVQVGGVRRASLISLSELGSHEMRGAKSGAWYQNSLQRMMANNSAVYDEEPDDITFMDEWLALAKSGSGERGIFNRDGVLKMLPKRRKKHRFGCNPCAEIILRPYQFCNLTIAVARHDDTPETLREKVRVAAIFGTLQAALTNFNYIRDDWRKNCEEEALLGVDVTGQMDCPILRPGAAGREELLEDFKRIAAETNEKWAARIGINRSASDTCVKPSGDSSAFFWCGSGIHAWFANFFIRRTRERGDSPVAKMLKDAGVPWIQAPEDPSLVCFEWPSRPAGEGAPTRTDFTAVQQLENWLVWKKHFAEHSVSCTIYVEPHEWLEVGVWVKRHFGQISGLSFMPRDNGVYSGTPYEEITEEQFKDRAAAFPDINWAKLARYEQEDLTDGAQTYACTAGGCELG